MIIYFYKQINLDWKRILSTTNFLSERLGCKEDLTYKWVENLIKETSRKLNKEILIREASRKLNKKKQVENLIGIILNSILQVSFGDHTVKKEQSTRY